MKKIAEKVLIYTMLTAAALVMSLGVIWIFNSEQIVPGGVTGIGIIIDNIFAVPVWVTNFIINIPLFICGYFILEKRSMIRTAYTTLLSTVFMALLPELPLLTQDRLLNMIIGGTMFGFAYGIMFRMNSSSGGVDLMALILNHFRRDIGAHLFLGGIDLVIIVAGGVAFGIENMVYAIIAIIISTRLSDRIIQGFKQGKLAYIISDNCMEIKKYIIEEIERGVTVLDAKGGYTDTSRVMMISVLSSRELVDLKDKLPEIDKNSFLIVGQITEVFGEGFTNLM